MPNLQNIIAENEQNFEEWLIRNIFSRFPSKKEEELVESAISAFDVTQLRLIEGFREMVREKMKVEKLGLCSDIQSIEYNEPLKEILSELGSINGVSNPLTNKN